MVGTVDPAMVFQALAASRRSAPWLRPFRVQGTAREAFTSGVVVSAAPVPARWGQVQELEQVLAVQGVPVNTATTARLAGGLYDPANKVLMCTNAMPDRSANYWNTRPSRSM